MQNRKLLELAALGLVGGLSTVASAQPYVVNASGATLLRNFLEARAFSNDFLDLDGDGIVTGSGVVDNLAFDFKDYTAPFAVNGAPANPSQNHFLTIQYRSVGSINGILELLEWGGDGYGTSFAAGRFATAAPVLPVPALGQDRTLTIITNPVDRAAAQGSDRYINSSALQGPNQPNNPGAAPVRSSTDGLYTAIDTASTAGGVQVNIAPVDVPFQWGLARGTVAQATSTDAPNQPGYGRNPRLAVRADGTAYPVGTAGTNNSLVDLSTSIVGVSINEASLYNTFIAQAVVGAMTNYGTGLQQIDESDLRHLALSGRRISGENLVQITREIGSGTRNAYYNSLGVDPSFGVGENVGNDNAGSAFDNLGASYVPSNKNGSGNMITSVINTRLGVGYTGAEQGVTGSGISQFLIAGSAELLAVRNDLQGGTVYARPNADNVVNNDANGYRIGGPAVFMTIGDPRNQNELGGTAGNNNPRMRNSRAAALLNNITRSIEAFTALPGGANTLFTPGQFLAQNFLLVGAPDFVQRAAIDPTSTNGRDWVANTTVPPATRAALEAFALGGANSNSSNLSVGRPAYYTFGLNGGDNGGTVPTRASGTYTDNNTGNQYRAFDGSLFAYATKLQTAGALRNKLAGDFDGNGSRNAADIAQLVAAFQWRNGANPTWSPADGIYGAGSGLKISPELLGDYNGDGNFTRADVRYHADGLALVAGKLDRKVGFTNVDNAFGGNFFSTTLLSGTYSNGDSRADIAGAAGITRGHTPVGHDGVVNFTDVDYIYAQFGRGTAGVSGLEVNWATEFQEVAFADLSADINGDLKVNLDDVIETVSCILEQPFADVNQDGSLNWNDADAIIANFGTAPATYLRGDLNGDNAIDDADLLIALRISPVAIPAGCNNPTFCINDLNADGFVDDGDFVVFASNYEAFIAPTDRRGDTNGDGFVDDTDFVSFAAAYEAFICP